jgi:hypothetical protein
MSPLMCMTRVSPSALIRVPMVEPIPCSGALTGLLRSLSSSWVLLVSSNPHTPRAPAPRPPRISSPAPSLVPPLSVRVRNRALHHPHVLDLVASFMARPGMRGQRRSARAEMSDSWFWVFDWRFLEYHVWRGFFSISVSGMYLYILAKGSGYES